MSLLSFTPIQARAEFPDHPISLVVAFPAGGRTDLNTRIVGDTLAGVLKTPVNVENRAGAGGAIAARYVADSAPDGYTLLVISAALIISSYTNENAPGLADFEPIAIVAQSSPVLVVRQDGDWNSVQDLVDDARQNPGSISIGSITGATAQVISTGFMEAAGITMTSVPFKGDADAVIALAGGHIDAYICGYSSARSMAEAGKIKVLAIAGNTPVAGLQDIPFLKDVGINFAGSLFDAVFAPKGTPQETLAMLDDAFGTALRDPTLLEKAHNAGLDPVFRGREDANEFLHREDAFYARVTEMLGLRR